MSRLSRQCGILDISQPYRPPRPIRGIGWIFLLYSFARIERGVWYGLAAFILRLTICWYGFMSGRWSHYSLLLHFLTYWNLAGEAISCCFEHVALKDNSPNTMRQKIAWTREYIQPPSPHIILRDYEQDFSRESRVVAGARSPTSAERYVCQIALHTSRTATSIVVTGSGCNCWLNPQLPSLRTTFIQR
jgi:hypothetical protein